MEELTHHQYKANLVFHIDLMKNNPSGVTKTTDAYFRSDVMTILSAHAIDVAIQKAFPEIQKRIEKGMRELKVRGGKSLKFLTSTSTSPSIPL